MKAIFSSKRRKLNKLFNKMKEIGDRHNLSIASVAISYVANKGIVPVCGCRKPYQVKQLKDASDTILSEDEIIELETISDELNVRVLGADLFRFAVKK